jgi:hypothetical protein
VATFKPVRSGIWCAKWTHSPLKEAIDRHDAAPHLSVLVAGFGSSFGLRFASMVEVSTELSCFLQCSTGLDRLLGHSM